MIRFERLHNFGANLGGPINGSRYPNEGYIGFGSIDTAMPLHVVVVPTATQCGEPIPWDDDIALAMRGQIFNNYPGAESGGDGRVSYRYVLGHPPKSDVQRSATDYARFFTGAGTNRGVHSKVGFRPQIRIDGQMSGAVFQVPWGFESSGVDAFELSVDGRLYSGQLSKVVDVIPHRPNNRPY